MKGVEVKINYQTNQERGTTSIINHLTEGNTINREWVLQAIPDEICKVLVRFPFVIVYVVCVENK